MKFKAKAIHSIDLLKAFGLYNHPAHHGDGWFKGYYVDGFIVGGFAEVTNDYASLEYWIPVDKRTLQILEEK